MNTHFLIALLCLAGASVPGIAAPAQQSQFDRWDRNKDGELTVEELPAALRQNFSRVDTNGDGVISREEDRSFLNRGNQRAGGRTSALPDTVQLKSDLSYIDDDNPRHQLDLLLPTSHSSDEKLPLIVFVHGGGWRQGNKRGGIRQVLRFVETGKFAGASVAYRLSDEAIWPAQIHDCKAAIRWLKAHADDYGIDSQRIAVWGSSAGGHLVAMLGTSAGVADMDGQLGEHTEIATDVQCVVDYYGPTDFLKMNATAIEGARLDHDAANSPESRLIGGAIQEHPDKVQSANPVTYVSSDDPPFLIVHGTRDPLVSFNQSELLHAALTKKNCDSTLIPVEGAGHGGFRNPAVLKTVDSFLRRHLLGEDVSISTKPIPQSSSN